MFAQGVVTGDLLSGVSYRGYYYQWFVTRGLLGGSFPGVCLGVCYQGFDTMGLLGSLLPGFCYQGFLPGV